MKSRLALYSVLLATLGCRAPLPFSNNLPPAEQIMHPGPGVDGPGPGVMTYANPPGPIVAQTSQIAFVGPEGMQVAWDLYSPGAFDSEPLVCPARFNFPQGAIYRLKLTSVPGRPGVELYPTLEIGPTMPRTDPYLAHNPIPFQLTEEDFDQVLTGNFVTKVIYLPDPEFQELALAGIDTLVSTRLDPGVDPIVEADRRGSILAVIRIGNKDLEIPGLEGFGGGVGGPGPGGMQAGYCPPGAGPGCGPMGVPAGDVGSLPGGYGPPANMAGVTAPQYGMPITGTPIGLPGPPHIPLGVPAGLQKHTIKNHTFVHIPGPTKKVKIHVKQTPGLTYPAPANHAYIHENARSGPLGFFQPLTNKFKTVGTTPTPGADCPPQ
jgi:hypothetical protein